MVKVSLVDRRTIADFSEGWGNTGERDGFGWAKFRQVMQECAAYELKGERDEKAAYFGFVLNNIP